jgi:transposase
MENSSSAAAESSFPGVTIPSKKTKQRRSVEERRRMVEASLAPGATIAAVAARHGVRANQLSAWRKLYREGHLGNAAKAAPRLLPVEVVKAALRSGGREGGCIELELARGQMRITGAVDAQALHSVLESLLR